MHLWIQAETEKHLQSHLSDCPFQFAFVLGHGTLLQKQTGRDSIYFSLLFIVYKPGKSGQELKQVNCT